MNSDVELVNRCLSNEESSIVEFVERFQGIVYGLCYRMMGHREDAEDAAQDSFVRAISHLNQWDQSRPIRPWLLTIAANRCRTALAKRTKSPEVTGLEVETTSSDQSTVSRELSEELELALEKLKPHLRTCFVLFYQEEMSCVEIGNIMDCPEGTVKTWLHRARKKLTEELKRRNLAPDQVTRKEK